MANDFFNASGAPTTNSPGQSSPIKNEFANIAIAFDKLPALTGHGNEIAVVNATGTGLTSGTPAALGLLTTALAASTYLPKAGGTLTGPLAGTSAVFSGNVSGAAAIFSGNVSGAAATFSGNVSAPNFFIGTQVATDAGTFGFSNSNGPGMIAWGSAAAGAGRMEFYAAGAKQAEVSPTAAAVNYVQLFGNTAGLRPGISIGGADVNIGFAFTSKGSGDFAWFANSGTQFQVTSTASANRFVIVSGSNGGNPTLTTSAGLLGVGSAIRETGGGSTASDVATSYTLLANDKLCWVDPTRSANNRQIEFNFSGGGLLGRFVNDAYGSASNWLFVSGGQAAGIASIDLLTSAQTMRLAGGYVNISPTAATAAYQLQVQGAGQTVANMTDAGAKGASIYLRDTAGAGPGQGGAVLFGGFDIATPFAGIKGYITDAASNSRGDIVFATRRIATDTALTETMRITFTGLIQDAAGNELGFKRLPAASVTTGAFVAADSGKCVYATAGVTVPNAVMAAGDVVTIYNNTAGNITITTATTLHQAGTANTGNRTLAQRGIATVLFISATEAVITGTGLT